MKSRIRTKRQVANPTERELLCIKSTVCWKIWNNRPQIVTSLTVWKTDKINKLINFFIFLFLNLLALWPNAGYGPPHSWGFYITHNDAPQSAGLLWTSDQLVAETSTWQYTTLTRDKYPCPGGIRTHSLSTVAAAHLYLRPRGHWDRQLTVLDITVKQTNIQSYYTSLFLWMYSCWKLSRGRVSACPLSFSCQIICLFISFQGLLWCIYFVWGMFTIHDQAVNRRRLIVEDRVRFRKSAY